MVTVKALADLRDPTTNVLDVPKGTLGIVKGFTIPPDTETWQIEFTIEEVPITRWVTPDEIAFIDGPIGPINAVLEKGVKSLTGASYPKVVSDTDVIIGNELATLRSVVDFEFLDGTKLELTSDQNTGEIRFRFKS